MHSVLAHAVALDGAERAGADVEGHLAAAYSAGVDVGEDAVGEVETGGGSGHGAFDA